jgi:hypothetical protein
MVWDLAVCYRVYPRLSGAPVMDFKDKLSLASTAVRSFQQALHGTRARIWALLDDCPPAYHKLFQEVFPADELEIVPLPRAGNGGSFAKQLEILSSQHCADYVYFAEDDYLYIPGAVTEMLAFLKQHPDADFVTGYDHLDYYRAGVHRHSREVLNHRGRTWRTVASTCLTFMCSRKTLKDSRGLLQSFCRGNSDLGLWLALTKTGMRNPLALGRAAIDGRFVIGSYGLAWWHGWRHQLFGRPARLWAPRPSLCTHMEKRTVAPGVNWEQATRSDPNQLRNNLFHEQSVGR